MEYPPVNFQRFDSVQHALDRLSEHERQTVTSFVTTSRRTKDSSCFGKKDDSKFDNEIRKTHQVRWEAVLRTPAGNLVIPSNDVPFYTLGTVEKSCKHGKDRHIAYKKKLAEAKLEKVLEGHKFRTKRLSQSTIKLDCPVKVVLKEIVYFPDYKITKSTLRKQKEASAKLRKDLTSGKHVASQHFIYMNIPSAEEHKNHATGKLCGMELNKLKDDVEKARQLVKDSPLCVRTPLWADCWHTVHQCFPQVSPECKPAKLSIKLENLQNFGSFKIRGIVNQFHHLPKEVIEGQVKLVTMSAGNYGRAFTEACVRNGMNGIVVLPDFAPSSRVQFIESKGLTAEKVPSCEITSRVEHYQRLGNKFLHPFDDPLLFFGYGSVAHEILEDDPSVDVIVACCGGGGFLAGVSAVAKLINPNCVVYGVEPHTANTMYRSFKSRKAAAYPEAKSIASGLSPPYAGENAYAICKDTVQKILLVDDTQIKSAVKALYSQGLVVEPAGSAAFAALMFNKIPNIANKNVAVVLTGRNMTLSELVDM